MLRKPKESEGLKAAIAELEKSQLKRFTLDIPSDLHRRVKKQALESNKTMREVCIEFIEQGLRM